MEIRDLIKEAAVRAGFPRRQPVPGDVQETALKFLQGIISKYNNDNYLAFTQVQLDLPAKLKIHIYDKEDTLAGDFNRYFDTTAQLLDQTNYPSEEDFDNGVWAIAKDNLSKIYDVQRVAPNTYRFVQKAFDPFDPRVQQMLNYAGAYHVQIKGVAKLNTLMVKYANENCVKLEWKPRDEFDSFYMTVPIWTYTERAQGEWIIETKKSTVNAATCYRLSYNRALHVEIDTDLRAPDAYIELLIVALTVAISEKYPRLDDAHINRLKDDLREMITNVSTPKAEGKMILRDYGSRIDKFTPTDIITGRCLF